METSFELDSSLRLDVDTIYLLGGQMYFSVLSAANLGPANAYIEYMYRLILVQTFGSTPLEYDLFLLVPVYSQERKPQREIERFNGF